MASNTLSRAIVTLNSAGDSTSDSGGTTQFKTGKAGVDVQDNDPGGTPFVGTFAIQACFEKPGSTDTTEWETIKDGADDAEYSEADLPLARTFEYIAPIQYRVKLLTQKPPALSSCRSETDHANNRGVRQWYRHDFSQGLNRQRRGRRFRRTH